MKGSFVSLEQCSSGDYERLANWFSAETSWYAIGRPRLYSPEDLKSENLNGSAHFLMVLENESRRRIGAVTFNKKSEYEGSYFVGSTIGDKEFFNRGYGIEASMLLLTYLFRTMNAHRVEYILGLYNTYMVSTLMTGLTTIEGILRDYFFLDGEYHDAAICSILSHEFDKIAAFAGDLNVFESIPKKEKADARKAFTEFIEKLPNRYLAELFTRARTR